MAAAAAAQQVSPQDVVQAVRDYALSYTRGLPKFMCTLTTRHVSRPPNAVNDPALKLTTIEEQLSFVDDKEVRQIVKVDGEERDSVRGPLSRGEFGTLLEIIFDPQKHTEVKWSRVATLEGRKADVLTYRVPQSSGYILVGSRGEIQVAFEGSVYADRQTHAVLRIQAKCVEFPRASDYGSVDLTLDYAPVKIAGKEYVLPSHFVLNYVNLRESRQNINDGRFSGYHEFSADSSIDFGGGR